MSNGEVAGPTQILLGCLHSGSPIGIPIRAASLPGLLAYSHLSMRSAEGERRNASQPVIPLMTAGNDRKCLLAGGVMEFVGPSLGVPGHAIQSCPRHRNKPLSAWYYLLYSGV